MYISEIFLYRVWIIPYTCICWIFRLFPGFRSLLVFYDCVAHCPKLSSLKRHTFVVSWNPGSGIWAQLSIVFCKPAIKASARTGFSSESLTGELLSSKLRFFLEAVDMVYCFLETRNGEQCFLQGETAVKKESYIT